METNNRKKWNFILNVLYIAAIALVAYVAWKFLGVIRPFVMALILVAILQPLIKWLQRKLKIKSSHLSVALIILLYAAVGSLAVWLIVRLVVLLMDVFPAIPEFYRSTLAPALENLGDQINGWLAANPTLQESFNSVADRLLTWLQSALVSLSQKGLSLLTGFAQGVPGFFIGALVTIMLSVYIGIQYDKIIAFLKAQLPLKWRERTEGLRKLMGGTVFKYFKAVLILIFITFVELCVGTLVIGAKNPIGVAAGIAIMDALPVLGTGTALIPWAVVKLVQGEFAFAIGLVVIYIVITVVRNIIEPKIVGDQLGINPVISLLAMYVGYRLLGIAGMILAPMLVHVLLVLHKDGRLRLYKETPPEEAGVEPKRDAKPPEENITPPEEVPKDVG